MCTKIQITQLAAKLWNELYPLSNYYKAATPSQQAFNNLAEKLLKGQISLEDPFKITEGKKNICK